MIRELAALVFVCVCVCVCVSLYFLPLGFHPFCFVIVIFIMHGWIL